ncbi:2-dehydropantoate 2-reductase [Oceaniferula spumae]|uniref:2-dehydropantoate 2-reductase n=1 Tax=Oceaniferula spumae TaxID=2979115 RepID=A0AAT9FQR9_9BACT
MTSNKKANSTDPLTEPWHIKKVAIVGSGAVGSYYGARLAKAGLEVVFLLRSDYSHVSEHGMKISSVAGDFELPQVNCRRSSREIGVVDLVIIAWKTTSNSQYFDVVSPLVGSQTRILTLQNGLGSAHELSNLFGAWRVYGGLCFVCINRLGPGQISHTASGLIRVGKYLGQERRLTQDERVELDYLVACLSNAEIDCEGVSSLERAQWMKLVWNIPFNGLAISEGGIDTKTLLAMPGMEQRVRRIMREVQQVAASLGHSIEDSFLDSQIEVTRPMDAYRPSSMIDYVEGRAVEVDSIWREPVRRAHEVGVPVPEIETLLQEIETRLSERE